jgi:hypothetical protein
MIRSWLRPIRCKAGDRRACWLWSTSAVPAHSPAPQSERWRLDDRHWHRYAAVQSYRLNWQLLVAGRKELCILRVRCWTKKGGAGKYMTHPNWTADPLPVPSGELMSGEHASPAS